MQAKQARSGFTLVEVLVVAAVVTMLFGVGIASYRQFDNKRKVEMAALGFATELRQIQKRADAGERPSSCAGYPLNGYEVEATNGNSYYEVTPDCTGSPPLAGQQVHLINKAIFGTGAGQFVVLFRTVGRGVSMLNPNNGITRITDNGQSVEYTITVDSGGAITVERV